MAYNFISLSDDAICNELLIASSSSEIAAKLEVVSKHIFIGLYGGHGPSKPQSHDVQLYFPAEVQPVEFAEFVRVLRSRDSR